MDEDNLSRQADEIEALSAIYDDDWCVIDSFDRVYCIIISNGEETPRRKLSLQIILPPEYPASAPPQYQLNAPWLRGQDRQHLSNALEDIYCKNLGESIIHLWVERIREFLEEGMAEGGNSADTSMESPEGNKVHQTEETDHSYDDEEGFDPKALEAELAELKAQAEQYNHNAPRGKDDKIEMPPIYHGDTLTDRRSTFQGHLAPVFYKEQVDMVMSSLLENKKIAMATHNIQAYRISLDQNGRQVMYQGCEDDGEIHAGSRMLHLLQIIGAENVLVVVTRWYGGIHLGPDRFKHINNCTRAMLEQQGYIKEKDTKKGPRSTKR